MGMPTKAALRLAHSEPRTRIALLLESIALRHQIAVLERSGTRRPCFRLWDRLFWILFSRWWPLWRDSLIIIQPETVLRWRREGWSALRLVGSAVGTQEGREKVIGWLKYMENGESRRSRKEGTPPCDFRWRWQELGVFGERR